MNKHTRRPGTFKSGSFQDFKEFTLAVVRGQRRINPGEPKIWIESTEPFRKRASPVRFQSLEAGAKLLSPKNRALLRIIADRQPKSVSELAILTHRAEQNVLRTLHKLSQAGLVRLDKGAGRAYQPVVTARRVHFEIDLLG
jgi:predicted transcriptional regulator